MYLKIFLNLLMCFDISNAAKPLTMPDPKQKTFEYTFTMNWKLTMAWYNDSSGLATLLKYDADQGKYLIKIADQNLPCNATSDVPDWASDFKGVVLADGKHRRMIMINGILPGPTVVVPLGSDIVVKIENRLSMEGISIHFHGIDKKDKWFMDGVSNMQQCPVAPGSDFVYRFTADTVGTHFYHGHLGTDRVEGAFGAVVVVAEDRSVTLHDNTKLVPDFEYSVVLFEMNSVSGTDLWFNYRWRTTKFLENYENEDKCWRPAKMIDGTHIDSFPLSGILINGKGWYNQADILQRPYQLDMETFPVEKGGKSYLFRMVNAGQAVALMVSVEGHKLEVVSTDGAPIKGVVADFIIIFPGERYDFLLITKENPDRDIYYMIVETLGYYDYYWQKIEPFYGLARIQYVKGTKKHELPNVNHDHCSETSKCTVVNCPFPVWPPGYGRFCVNKEKLQYIGSVQKEVLRQSYAEGDKYEEYFLDDVMNGWLFQYPKGPPYFYARNESAVMYPCPSNNWKGIENSWCTYTLNITLGSVVQLVLYNTGFAGNLKDDSPHPIHLHGAHFYVVKVGYGQYNQTTGILETENRDVRCADPRNNFCNSNLTWGNRTWLNGNVPDMNLVDPVYKDTVTLPVGGYVVLRFKADNPGWWVMHCHIMVHHMDGMAIALRIGDHDQMPKPPANFPKCGVFDPLDAGAQRGTDVYEPIVLMQIMFVFLRLFFLWCRGPN